MIRIILITISLSSIALEAKPNLVLVLSDDHRHDFMGFHPDSPEWLETPTMDKLASEGAHIKNAFVSTSLCSPSRASILTGQYMHRHRVVDNQREVPMGTVFFPEHLVEDLLNFRRRVCRSFWLDLAFQDPPGKTDQ